MHANQPGADGGSQLRSRALTWTIVGGLVGLVLAVGLLAFTRLLGPPAASPLPELTVIPLPSATATPTAAPPTPEPPTAAPDDIGDGAGPRSFVTGQLVLITGTGGEGLRLREAPGLNAAIRLVALESEVFEVVEGPIPSDGYNWWRLTNPYDRAKDGWAADQFLEGLEQ